MKKILICILMCTSVAKANNYNFRFSPILALVGYIQADLDIAVSPNWTVGPTLGFWNFDSSSLSDNSTTGYSYKYLSLGARGNWFANGVFKDGLYLAPQLEFVTVNVKSKNSTSDLSGKATATILGAYLGYGWFWQSFNQMLGAGFKTASLGKIEIEDSSGAVVDETKSSNLSAFSIEYTLGWTF